MPIVDYSKSIIYKLCCKDPSITDIYVGSTTNFTKRKSQHKHCCLTEIDKSYNTYKYQFIREHGGWNNWDMVMVEQFSCNNKMECFAKERYYIETLNSTLNQCVPNHSKNEWYDENKAIIKQQNKEWAENNKDAVKQSHKKYYEEHKDTIKQQHKQYYETHKEQISQYKKEWAEKNKDAVKQHKKRWRDKNKETIDLPKNMNRNYLPLSKIFSCVKLIENV
jgi:hypothetical protein